MTEWFPETRRGWKRLCAAWRECCDAWKAERAVRRIVRASVRQGRKPRPTGRSRKP